ncbi:MAG: AtpZ/AtpI family protein [Fimbriimonadales bacterium]|nr:AtpZ/AtpI family protein [Fimbriimonadales bacterium]
MSDERLPEDSLREEVDKRKLDAELSDEMLSEIDSIAERAKNARSRHDSIQTKQSKGAFGDRKSSRSLGVGLTIAYVIVLMPVGGYFIGRLIDNQTGGNAWSSWLTIICATLGVAFAIAILSKHQNKL